MVIPALKGAAYAVLTGAAAALSSYSQTNSWRTAAIAGATTFIVSALGLLGYKGVQQLQANSPGDMATSRK